MKKNKKQNIVMISIAVIIISGIIAYNYNIDKIKTIGFTFGNELSQIQDTVRTSQIEFDSNLKRFKEDTITQEEFSKFADTHITKITELISKYDMLNPPDPFIPSVNLLKLSTETQLKAQKLEINWVDTKDDSELIRAGEIYQEAFEYETVGIGSFNAAKAGTP